MYVKLTEREIEAIRCALGSLQGLEDLSSAYKQDIKALERVINKTNSPNSVEQKIKKAIAFQKSLLKKIKNSKGFNDGEDDDMKNFDRCISTLQAYQNVLKILK